MKLLWAVLFLLFTVPLFGQSAILDNHEVYYSINEIVNYRDKKITLRDNTQWKLNMPLVAWSLKQGIMVKDKLNNFGLGYVDGYEYSVTYLGPYELTNLAKYLKVIAVHPEKNMVLLANNEVWMYGEEEANKIEKIDLPFNVLLDSERKIIILPMQDTFLNAMLVSKDDLKSVTKK